MTIVPYQHLQPDTLTRLIEEFVTRDGSVHGHTDVPVDEMRRSVQRQLIAGKIVVVFDEDNQTCSIVACESL